MKAHKILITSLALSLIFFVSCNGPLEEIETTTVLSTITLNAEDSVVENYSRSKNNGHSGQFSFRTDSTNEYAATTKIDIHDSLVNSAIRIVLNYWTRTSNPLKGDGVSVAFQDDKEMISFFSFDAINYGIKANEWINIIDSVTISPEMNNKSGRYFKVFGFNPNKKAKVDIDDINITVKKVVTTLE